MRLESRKAEGQMEVGGLRDRGMDLGRSTKGITGRGTSTKGNTKKGIEQN